VDGLADTLKLLLSDAVGDVRMHSRVAFWAFHSKFGDKARKCVCVMDVVTWCDVM